MMLPLFAPPVDEENRITPSDAPFTMQYFIVLVCAPLMKRMVEVLALEEALPFEMVRPMVSPV